MFDFHAKYSPFPTSQEEWDAALADMAAISNGNGNSPFIVAMLLAVWEELERSAQRTG